LKEIISPLQSKNCERRTTTIDQAAKRARQTTPGEFPDMFVTAIPVDFLKNVR
jgi:hypothetical protein